MYTFPNKLKNIARALMLLGFIGLVIGFLNAPKNVAEAKAMVATEHHGASHAESKDIHAEDSHAEGSHAEDTHAEASHREESHDSSHDEHLLHQLQNKPWAALYVAAFFFFMIPLGVLAFYAIQRAAQAGWSPVLYRVMEGITGYLLPGGIIVIVILALSGMHFNHLFIWMDPEVVAHDKLIAGKTAFLNVPFFLGRAVFFLAGWTLYRYYSRKFSLAQDESSDISNHKKNFRISAGFLVFGLCQSIHTGSVLSLDGMFLQVCL
jgi:hypothetical protein